MWRTELKNSQCQPIIITLVYLLLMLLLMWALEETYIDDVIFVLFFLVLIEWWRAIQAFKKVKGELALFLHSNELYCFRQRWFIVRSPLFLRYAVILHLVAKRNGKKRILFVMNDSFRAKIGEVLIIFFAN